MKIKDTNKIAHQIMTHYGNEDFVEYVSELSSSNDLYIHIETSGGSVIFEPMTYGSQPERLYKGNRRFKEISFRKHRTECSYQNTCKRYQL